VGSVGPSGATKATALSYNGKKWTAQTIFILLWRAGQLAKAIHALEINAA